MNKKNMKPIIIYAFTALIAFIADKIYALFSHGVGSKSMSSVWIWLLCTGSFFYFILALICVKIKKFKPDRFSANIYNSGVSVYAAGMFLGGVFEIAGTGSDLIFYYKIAGILFMAAGIVSMVIKQFYFSHNEGKYS